MTINYPVSLPHFVPNQFLQADDLNAIIDQLDLQQRLTNVFLHGMGIICGLEVSYKLDDKGKPCVNISAGYGLSSDGFLIKSEACTLKSIRKFDISTDNDLTLCSKVLTELDCEIDIYELIEDQPAEDDSNALSIDNLNNKVLLIAVVKMDIFSSGCINSCNETGADREFKVVKLLVDKSCLVDPQEEMENEGQEEKCPPMPCINRYGTVLPGNIGQGPIDLSVITQGSFKSHYIETLKLSKPWIVEAYDFAFQCMQELTKPIWPSNPFHQIPCGEDDRFIKLDAFLDQLIVFLNASTGKEMYLTQYIYDYFKDLILAYREFMDCCAQFLDYDGPVCPDFCAFPAYLALANFVVPIGEEDDPVDLSCRNWWMASCLEKQDYALLQKVICLFQRMIELTQSFFISCGEEEAKFVGTPANLENIRITGSRGKEVDLSQRAIPYYYYTAAGVPLKPALLENWNFQFKRKKRYTLIPSYYLNQEAPPPFDLSNQLIYDLDAFNFLRIEGHMGCELTTVYNEVVLQRKNFNLPFDIKCIQLGVDLSQVEIHTDLDLTDLQALYTCKRDDFCCKLEDLFRPFLGLDKRLDQLLEELEDVVARTNVTAIKKELTDLKLLMLINDLKECLPGMLSDLELGDEFIFPDGEDMGFPFGRLRTKYEVFKKKLKDTVSERSELMEDINIYNLNLSLNDPLRIADFPPEIDCHYLDCCLKDLEKLAFHYFRCQVDYRAIHLYQNFVTYHPGMEHGAGVSKGGTLIFLYCIVGTERRIVGDFYLPYYCCEPKFQTDNRLIIPEGYLYLGPTDICCCPNEDHNKCLPIMTYPVTGILSATYDNGGGDMNIDPYPMADVLIPDGTGTGRYLFYPCRLDFGTQISIDVTFTYMLAAPQVEKTAMIKIWKKPVDPEGRIMPGTETTTDPLDPDRFGFTFSFIGDLDPLVYMFEWKVYIAETTQEVTDIGDSVPMNEGTFTPTLSFQEIEAFDIRLTVSAGPLEECRTVYRLGPITRPEMSGASQKVLTRTFPRKRPSVSAKEEKSPNTKSNRLNAWEARLQALGASDEVLAGYASFKATDQLMNSEASDLESLNKDFKKTAGMIFNLLNRPKPPKVAKTKIKSLLGLLFSYWLDANVKLEPAQVPPDTKTQMEAFLNKCKEDKIRLSKTSLRKAWNAEELKKVTSAKVIDAYVKLLK